MRDPIVEMYEHGATIPDDERIEYRGYLIKRSSKRPVSFEIYDSIGELVGVVWPDEHEIIEGFEHEVDQILNEHQENDD